MYQSPKPFVLLFDWQEIIERGDVVLFRFPIADDEDSNRDHKPKRRPCLVLDVFSKSETTFVELAYCTSAATKANRGHEVRVTQRASCHSSAAPDVGHPQNRNTRTDHLCAGVKDLP